MANEEVQSHLKDSERSLQQENSNCRRADVPEAEGNLQNSLIIRNKLGLIYFSPLKKLFSVFIKGISSQFLTYEFEAL